LHVVHVQTVHKNLMNHADEEYTEAGVTQADITKKVPKATTQVGVNCIMQDLNMDQM